MCSEEESNINRTLQTDTNANLTRLESQYSYEHLILQSCNQYEYLNAYIGRLECEAGQIKKLHNQGKEEKLKLECVCRTLAEEKHTLETNNQRLKKELLKAKSDSERMDKLLKREHTKVLSLEENNVRLNQQNTRLSTMLLTTTRGNDRNQVTVTLQNEKQICEPQESDTDSLGEGNEQTQEDNESSTESLQLERKDQISKTEQEGNENSLKEETDQTKDDTESNPIIDQTCQQELIPFEVIDTKKTDNGSNPDIVKSESKDQTSQEELIPYEVIDTQKTDNGRFEMKLNGERKAFVFQEDLDLDTFFKDSYMTSVNQRNKLDTVNIYNINGKTVQVGCLNKH